MGLFPCSLCARRFRGPAQTIYPSVLGGNVRASAHLRLCSSCYDDMHERLTAHAIQLSLEGTEDLDINLCCACGDAISKGKELTVFATVYPRGEDRVDFLGAVHEHCAPELTRAWRLSTAS